MNPGVYYLADPWPNGFVRYVGETKHPEVRMLQYFGEGRRTGASGYLQMWLLWLRLRGLGNPKFLVVEPVPMPDPRHLSLAEHRALWKHQLRAAEARHIALLAPHCDLLNACQWRQRGGPSPLELRRFPKLREAWWNKHFEPTLKDARGVFAPSVPPWLTGANSHGDQIVPTGVPNNPVV